MNIVIFKCRRKIQVNKAIKQIALNQINSANLFIYLFIYLFCIHSWLTANEITVYNKNSYVYTHAN